MFWRKWKTKEYVDSPSLSTLANRLGVERRRNVRIRYPQSLNVCKLPQIFFGDHPLKIQDISVGGCCLLDPAQFLGPSIGNEVDLTIEWSTGREPVKARIISRVDHRRHIQFLDLAKNRKAQLTKYMSYGMRGLKVKRHAFSSDLGPTIHAAELWSSPDGDSVVLENDVHRLGQIFLQNVQMQIFREAWPGKTSGGKCSRIEFEHLILFLSNIPLPSPGLIELQIALEVRFERGEL